MKKVLIVDDETQVVELLTIVLEGDHHELFAAFDGEEALEVVRRERPHLVLSDVMMPRLDGRELCRQIKADPSTRDTSVILMSAMHRLDPGESGADEVISKPFDITSVQNVVNRLLARPT